MTFKTEEFFVSKVTNKMFGTEVPLWRSYPACLVKYLYSGLENVSTFKESHTKQKIPAPSIAF